MLSDPVRVLVADDHPIYREGVVRAVSAVAVVVAEVSSGAEAIAVIRQERPQVAVLDYRMPKLTGAQVACLVRQEELPTRIVILSAYNDSSTVYLALQDGVAGYLTKGAGAAEIGEAVLACAAGGTVIPQSLTQGLVHEIRARAENEAPLLSKRELQVLDLIAAGHSVPEISRRIFLAPTTIKSHVQRVYEKLGVSTRGAVVAEAMRRGLLQ